VRKRYEYVCISIHSYTSKITLISTDTTKYTPTSCDMNIYIYIHITKTRMYIHMCVCTFTCVCIYECISRYFCIYESLCKCLFWYGHVHISIFL